ncbi:MAG: DUF1730 domain-containing protein, partial [Phycisphaerales bacterium]|nr:DUF1730 domain-containing protein [Phycisphaerales bacterium]
MVSRRLGKTEYNVSAIGFGAFKIGRNTGIKYPAGYELPDDRQVAALLDGLLEMGVTLFDTAPAYGDSEDRLGRYLARSRQRDDGLIITTKVGEHFHDGQSTYSYTARDVRASLEASLRRLRVDTLDLVFVHSNGDDLSILHETDVVPTLLAARDDGLARHIGFSGKTVDGARAALAWADALMVEYHRDDTSHDAVMREAKAAGFDAVGVTTPDSIGNVPARLAAFLDAGFHGTMGWMAERAQWRASPAALWPEVRSVVMLAMNYGPDTDPLATIARHERAGISVYARNRDYHDVIKGRLKTIAGKLAAASGRPVKVFVDTAPVMEKPLAAAAG